ncbi:MAG: FHA domain-containing protein [Fibrobacter sp.]|nr:FHA domain-containing protein [Fibrobacter sp.]
MSGEETLKLALDGTEILLGRDPSCRICLSGIGISRKHASVLLHQSGPVICDLQSTFGIRVNGSLLDAPAVLDSGDILTIGIRNFEVRIDDCFLNLEEIRPDQRRDISETGSDRCLKIGREQDCQIQLSHPLVSRLHATASRLSDGSFLVTDNRSTNGTFINGHPVSSGQLNEGDVLQIGPYRLFVDNGRLVRADDSNRIRIEVAGLHVRRNGTALLSDISLSFSPGEFVALLGPSGAGKSTLVRALTGRIKADSGEVFANGLPLGRFLGAFASNIGYVSQENLLYQELTVEETFSEQSMLRLPRDSTPSERKTRIDEVIELLDLKKVADRRISRLSGGEAKRVHLGIELLSSPALIFLDEPLAGLDPGLVRRFMRLFRRVSDRGHTLLLTTHTLEQIELCDQAVFLNRGKVVYNGPPSEMGSAFNAKSLAEVYDRISENDTQPVVEKKRPARMRHKNTGVSVPARVHKVRTISFGLQIILLVKRYFKILVRDRRNLFLLLLQAPLIAVLLGLVFRGGTGFLPLSFYFCITVSAIWIGGVNSIREIAREWQLVARDNNAGLRLTAYLFSKVTLASAVSFLQTILFCFSLQFIFGSFKLSPGIFLITLAATFSGAILGLFISSWSGHVGRAITILPILFIPQIFFSGILIPFDRMTSLGRAISHMTISRPVFGMLKQTSLLQRPVLEFREWNALFILISVLIILTQTAVSRHISRR